MWPGTLSVCMHVYACARVYLYCVPMRVLVPPSRTYMHVCTFVCARVYTPMDVCACVSWVEMPLFHDSDQALLQNAVLRVAAPPSVHRGHLWPVGPPKPRRCF